MNENKKKLSFKDILILIFSILIIAFQCIIMINQYTHECPNLENDVKTSLVQHTRSNRKVEVINNDLIIGDYSLSFTYYYPKSFGGQSFLTNTESGLKVAEFEDDTSVWMQWDNTNQGIHVYLVDNNGTYTIGRWNYLNYQYTLDENYGVGILKTTNMTVKDIPYLVEGETAYTNIITIGMLTTVQQTYTVTPNYYTYIGNVTVTEDDGSYQEGYDLGYANGYQEGYDNGMQVGGSASYQEGYEDGYNAFEEELAEDPESKGYVTKDYYDESIQIAEDTYYQAGKDSVINNPNENGLYSQQQYDDNYDKGFRDGVDSVPAGIDENGFKILFNSILNAPYNIFNGILNFELFGVNVFNLLSFVFTIAIIAFVVKLLLTK